MISYSNFCLLYPFQEPSVQIHSPFSVRHFWQYQFDTQLLCERNHNHSLQCLYVLGNPDRGFWLTCIGQREVRLLSISDFVKFTFLSVNSHIFISHHNNAMSVKKEVEAVVGERAIRTKKEYLIRWKGYGDEANSWEKEKRVPCGELINHFREHGIKPRLDHFTVVSSFREHSEWKLHCEK